MKRYEKNIGDFLTTPAEMLLPGITTECVILGFNEGGITVLLNRYKTYPAWMLPGGFVYKAEGIEEAARRLLKLRTSLKDCYLRQFAAFGEPDEGIIEENRLLLKEYNLAGMDSHWMLNRFVSIGYYAFVNYGRVLVKPTPDEECGWFSLDRLPPLYGNHKKIIGDAIRSIRMEINYIPIGLELLPEKFTMSELRVIYETILGKKLDRRNFQRRILSYGYLCKLDEASRKWGVKETALFSFNKGKYLKAIEQGLNFF